MASSSYIPTYSIGNVQQSTVCEYYSYLMISLEEFLKNHYLLKIILNEILKWPLNQICHVYNINGCSISSSRSRLITKKILLYLLLLKRISSNKKSNYTAGNSCFVSRPLPVGLCLPSLYLLRCRSLNFSPCFSFLSYRRANFCCLGSCLVCDFSMLLPYALSNLVSR